MQVQDQILSLLKLLLFTVDFSALIFIFQMVHETIIPNSVFFGMFLNFEPRVGLSLGTLPG